MATATDTKALQVVQTETGELIEVNLGGAQQPEQADIREAKALKDVDGPFAVVGVRIADGQTFQGEYAEVLFLQTKKLELAVTASQEIVQAFRRVMVRGLATPQAPLLTKLETAKTSAGFTVHKLASLDEKEEAELRAALS